MTTTIKDTQDYATRLARLTADQRRQLARKLGISAGKTSPSGGKLTACIRTRSQVTLDLEQLKQYARSHLPDYMLPQRFLLVDDFPRTAAGKIDRGALSLHDWQVTEEPAGGDSGFEGPRNAVEETLAAIWAEVLGVEQIGVHDDFYEVGGDSLLSIRILARANKAGLRVSPEDFFAYPTIAGQSGLVGTSSARSEGPGKPTEAGLSPIQHWFFDRIGAHWQQWNQSVCLRVPAHLDYESLKPALLELMRRHEVLRAGFPDGATGRRQIVQALTQNTPVSRLDLNACAQSDIHVRLEREANRINRGLDPEQGRVFELLFAGTAGQSDNFLVVVIHHLVIDAESWRVLLADLESLWTACAGGEECELPVEAASFLQWTSRLGDYARSADLTAQIAYWRRLAQADVAPLPLDHESALDRNSNGSVEVLSVSLDIDETEALLRSVASTYRSEINDALLSALWSAIHAWSPGQNLLVDVEGHGRDYLFDDLDVTRTVGWFTTVYPVLLSQGGAGSAADLLLHIKETLRAVPGSGIGHGLLRYLRQSPDNHSPLETRPLACFNYLGQVDKLQSLSGELELVSEHFGESRHPDAPRAYQLEFNTKIQAGKLYLDCIYSKNLHEKATVERLAGQFLAYLRDLVTEASRSESQVFTPSDFPMADLDHEELASIAGMLSDVDDAN